MHSKDFKAILDKSDIREFKLMDGSTIMCEVVDVNDGKYLISEPMVMTVDLTRGMVMYPWFFSDGNPYVEIDESKVVTSNIVSDSLKTTYMRQILKLQVQALDEEESTEFYLDTDRPDSESVH